MLVALLFTFQAYALKLPAGVTDRVRVSSACAVLLEAATEAPNVSVAEARAVADRFAQRHLPIAVYQGQAPLGSLRVMTSDGSSKDALASSRFLHALESRTDVVGESGGGVDLFDLLSQIKNRAGQHHQEDAGELRRSLRWYSLISIGGTATAAWGYATNQPGLAAAGAVIATLPARVFYRTLKSLDAHLKETTTWLQRIALAPRAGEWVHVHAVTDDGVILDLIAFVDTDLRPRFASFISE